jgi:hypothetical protein
MPQLPSQIKRFPLLTTSRAYPLGLAERVTFSFLAYQDRIDQTASVRKIAAETGLNGRTVTKALATLGSVVLNVNGRWQSAQPIGDHADWFVPRKTTHEINHWTDSLASLKFLVPKKGAVINESRFTANHAAVYSMLVSLARKGEAVTGTSLRHLSGLLCQIDVATVAKAIKMLETARMIAVIQYERRMDVHLLSLGSDQQKLFQAVERPQSQDRPSGDSPPTRPNFPNQLLGDIYDYTMLHGIPHDVAMDLVTFTTMFEHAEAEHRSNVVAGKVNCSHFGNLMLYKLKQRTEAQEVAYGIATLSIRPEAQVESIEQLRRDREAEAAADPMHEFFDPAHVGSMTSRVDVSAKTGQQLIDQIEGHIGRHLAAASVSTENMSDLRIDTRNAVLKSAFQSINSHYHQPTKATVETFQTAINNALATCGFQPLYSVPVNNHSPPLVMPGSA